MLLQTLKKFACCIILTLFIFIGKVYSQAPANDDCSNAISISIPGNGFSLGTFSSSNIDISNATVQTDENFAPAIFVAGQNKKSVWYKFSIPTTRSVKVTLGQPGVGIAAGDVGFAIYKTTNCLPSLTEISTKFTPNPLFGDSYHPCVDQGEYLVQVSSKTSANGLLFIKIELGEPSPALYDKPATAQQLGNLSAYEITAGEFEVSCQSIDDANENCLPETSFKDFTKSTWHTFTTPNSFDYLAFLLGAVDPYAYYNPNFVVGYRLYEGDAVNSPLSALVQIGGCDSLVTNGYYPDRKMYKCGELKTNTTYTVQLLYHRDFAKTIRIAVAWDGGTPTNAPEPLASMTSPNNMGTLLYSANGTQNQATDNFSCNSKHSEHSCPKSMPVNGIKYSNGNNYNLSTFFYFTLATTSSVSLTLSSSCYTGYGRLYKQTLTNNCNDLDTANIISNFYYNTSINCLEPGNYVLQAMGVDTTAAKTSLSYYSLQTSPINYYCIAGSLGSQVTAIINVSNTKNENNFSLSSPGKFGKINADLNGDMQPFVPYTYYSSIPDTFGCANTVTPKDPDLCPDRDKSSYNEFKVNDSAIIYFPYFNYYSKLYKGDADALATAQNVHSFGETIQGLEPNSNCLYSNGSYTQNACVVPGTYTLVGFGTYVGRVSTFNDLSIRTPQSKHASPATAQDMGDLWEVGKTTGYLIASDIDTFTCRDNEVVIDGVSPCNGGSGTRNKLIYRQFYLSSPASVNISTYNYAYGGYYGLLSLFKGKATDGLSALTTMGSKWTCFSNAYNIGQCDVLPAGWYTVVSYGFGPTYENPLKNLYAGSNYSEVGQASRFFISLGTACAEPTFNRPYKASIDTATKKPYLIEWGAQSASTAAYPVTSQKYTLISEHFNCTQDTAFIKQNMVSCNSTNVKVAFYVFKTTQESYLTIDGIDNGLWTTVYPFDVRTADSSKLLTDAPLQPCMNKKASIELNKLQPGTYTLVFFAPDYYTCNTVTPTIYIDQVGYSRFDHAANAYDFGSVPPDSVWHNGKVGDINPLNSSRAPSNDFFYATTGAEENDATSAAQCLSLYNKNIYASGNDIVLHPDNITAPDSYIIDRRNLWYTFTVNEPGNVRIQVQNKTPGKTHQYPFAIFKSDVDGNLPFSQVVTDGLTDSTLTQGLSFITSNIYIYYYYCYGSSEVGFYVDPCDFKPTRYYVLVENRNPYAFDDIHAMNPNSQVEVSVLLDSASAIRPKFDHFSQANDMGEVNSGKKKGETDNLSCATKDATDPLYAYTNCQKTLWYKFTTTTTGLIRYASFFKNGYNYYYDKIQLFRQIKPNDSTSNGLLHLPYTTIYYDNGYWAQQCITPGTYYILLPGCDAVNEDIYPEIDIIPQAGDFCSAPAIVQLNGATSVSATLIPDCHTIGTDYGEFGTNLTCPPGLATNLYKTSWFRMDIGGADTLDVTAYLVENTNAASTDIKYRLMTGDCGAMQEQSCVEDALTQNTYQCLLPGQQYYVQVFTPISKSGYSVTGTIDLKLSAIKHVDSCAPPPKCLANVNFIPQFDCKTDTAVRFINYSTYGTSIKYKWDFNNNNDTSTDVSPNYFFPPLADAKTYNVTLNIENNTCGARDSITIPVTVPGRPYLYLGNDITNCNYDSSILLNATSFAGATYTWQDGSTNPTFNATAKGNNRYTVTVNYNNCIIKDTINIFNNPVQKNASKDLIFCNADSVYINAATGPFYYNAQYNYPTYLWNTGVTSASIYAKTTDTYWVDKTLNGCTVRDTFNVAGATEFKPLGNDTAFCFSKGGTTLNATVPNANSYVWQDGLSYSAQYTITKPGQYWVAINYAGCTIRDTIAVTDATPIKPVITGTLQFCSGDSALINTGSGYISYLWSNGDTAQSIYVKSPGQYTVTADDGNGCTSASSPVTVLENSKPVPSISGSNYICYGDSTTLTSSSTFSTYTWSNGTTAKSTIAKTAGQVDLTVTDNNGCIGKTNIDIMVSQPATNNSLSTTICKGSNYQLPSGKIVFSTGLYKDTVYSVRGCDSLITNVNLSVFAPVTKSVSAIICAGQQFLLPSGASVSGSGIYKDTIRNNNGCDSIITTVTLGVTTPVSTVQNATICAGQNFTLPSGIVVTNSGVYQSILQNIAGCDSIIINTTLSVTNPINNTLTASICLGSNYTLPSGKTVNITGTYADTIRTVLGCDSLRTNLILTVFAKTINNATAAICAGQTYTLPSGKTVSTSGLYKDTLRNSTGCDSIINNIQLNVQSVSANASNANICFGQSYALPSGKLISSTGIYKDTLRNSLGCDSLITTVNLAVTTPVNNTLTASICQGSNYTLPSGKTVNASGTYADTIRTVLGCDSLRTNLTLTVFAKTINNATAAICAGQTYMLPSGKTVSTSGLYKDTLRNSTGCDSIINNIQLSVQSVSAAAANANICFGQSYMLPSGKLISSTGIYKDTLRNSLGCDSLITTVNLAVLSPIAQVLTPAICFGSNYILPSGKTITSAGNYQDTVHSRNGCDSIISTINLSVYTVNTTNNSATICFGSAYTLPSGKTVNQTGIFADTLKNKAGCDSLITNINLQVKNPAIINTINGSICGNQTYTLPWGVTVSVAGLYSDTVRSTLGCDSIITNVTIKNEILSFGIQPATAAVCAGDTLQLTAYGGDTYQWLATNNITSTNTAVTQVFPLTPTTYQVIVTNLACNIAQTVSINVGILPKPVVSIIKSNDVDCVIGTAKLTAAGGVNYAWSPTTSISNARIAAPTVTPSVTTTYMVTVTSAQGCVAQDSIQVKVNPGNPENGYLVPSAFTPNNDGTNDCFSVKKWGYVTDFKLSVYDRWGNQLFTTTDINNCWDGTYKGMLKEPGTYIYQVSAKAICGYVYRKGTLVLIR